MPSETSRFDAERHGANEVPAPVGIESTFTAGDEEMTAETARLEQLLATARKVEGKSNKVAIAIPDANMDTVLEIGQLGGVAGIERRIADQNIRSLERRHVSLANQAGQDAINERQSWQLGRDKSEQLAIAAEVHMRFSAKNKKGMDLNTPVDRDAVEEVTRAAKSTDPAKLLEHYQANVREAEENLARLDSSVPGLAEYNRVTLALSKLKRQQAQRVAVQENVQRSAAEKMLAPQVPDVNPTMPPVAPVRQPTPPKKSFGSIVREFFGG